VGILSLKSVIDLNGETALMSLSETYALKYWCAVRLELGLRHAAVARWGCGQENRLGPRLRVDEGDRLKTVELDIVDELGARAAALENDLTLMKGGKFRTMTDADDGRVCELPRQQSHQTILAA
jgi:hypothetical protein